MTELQSLDQLRDPRMVRVARLFARLIESYGQRVTVTSVGRSRAKQTALWQRCMAGLSNFPAAAPGSSPHELGIAFDLMLTPPGPGVPESRAFAYYRPWGELWESFGLRWGGRFRDSIHFDFYPRGFRPKADPRSCPGPRARR